jgi:hypothetical protein
MNSVRAAHTVPVHMLFSIRTLAKLGHATLGNMMAEESAMQTMALVPADAKRLLVQPAFNARCYGWTIVNLGRSTARMNIRYREGSKLMRLSVCTASILLATFSLAQAVGSEKVSTPNRTMSVSQDYSDQTMPLWSRGYVFYLGSEDGSVTVYSAGTDSAKIALQTRIWPAGTSIVRMHAASAAPSGIFAVGGTAFTGSGSGSGFIAFFGPGQNPMLVQLPNTSIAALVFADDGTLWALVRQIDSSLNELSAYDLIRHYSVEGRLLGTAISRSALASATKGVTQGAASMTASRDTIGVYLDRAGIWAELSYDGSIRGLWQFPKTPLGAGQRLGFERVVLTGANEVIRASEVRGKNPKDTIVKVEQLQKSGASLTPAALDYSAVSSVSYPFLMGADNDQLVWHASRDKILWTKLE